MYSSGLSIGAYSYMLNFMELVCIYRIMTLSDMGVKPNIDAFMFFDKRTATSLLPEK